MHDHKRATSMLLGMSLLAIYACSGVSDIADNTSKSSGATMSGCAGTTATAAPPSSSAGASAGAARPTSTNGPTPSRPSSGTAGDPQPRGRGWLCTAGSFEPGGQR